MVNADDQRAGASQLNPLGSLAPSRWILLLATSMSS